MARVTLFAQIDGYPQRVIGYAEGRNQEEIVVGLTELLGELSDYIRDTWELPVEDYDLNVSYD